MFKQGDSLTTKAEIECLLLCNNSTVICELVFKLSLQHAYQRNFAELFLEKT